MSEEVTIIKKENIRVKFQGRQEFDDALEQFFHWASSGTEPWDLEDPHKCKEKILAYVETIEGLARYWREEWAQVIS